MTLTVTEKLKIQRENVDIKKQLKSGTLKPLDKIKLQRQWADNMKKLKGTAGTAELKDDNQTLIDQYVAGEFNKQAIYDFIKTIRNVEAAGGILSQLKIGAQKWVEFNATSLALV